jgi:hypothetical protein
MFTFRNFLVILAISAFLPIKMNAEWVSLNKNNTPKTPPVVTLISDDNNSTVLKVDISGFDVKDFDVEGKTYQSVDLLSEIFAVEPGYPALPYIAKTLAIPDQAGVSVEVIETGEVQTFQNIHIQPARESWIEGQPETPYLENSKAYQSSGVFPQDYTSTDAPAIFRDFRIARVSVFPIRYIASKNELQVVSSITVRVNYGSGNAINPKLTAKKKIAPSFGKIYESFIFNYKSVLEKQYGGKEEGHEMMLCIMPDDFIESFQVYADWKRESGTDVHVTKFSDIGANATNPNIIKDHITDAYNNWEYPPTYILIVGDDGVFPTKIVSYDYSFVNEDFFVEIEGDDYLPEIMIGRFTNQGDYRMQVMINKFLKYEKEPYTEDTDWFKHGICCSNNEYESQVVTKRYAAERMREDGGFTVDTLMSDGYWSSGCSMDLSDVTNAINQGRSYLNYRGEGWYDGWHANCYEFSPSDVFNLNNGEKFTFVTSIGCGVAMFDAGGGNCFGETWVQLGSLSAPRGGVAFVGPTSNTHTTYNNKIDKGIYKGMFMEGMDTPGQALLRGKLYMYNVFGNTYWVEYQYRVFCVLGDPSIHIWKEVPLNVSVAHPSSITVGINQIEITTTYASTGLPVTNAEVCITGEDIFITAVTDELGKTTIGFAPESAETLTITVRGGDVIPFQGSIVVTQPEEVVELEPNPEIVDLDGNLDGLINPNENCNITFTLKNWGTQTANNVYVTITASDPDFVEVITTDPVDFGNLTPGNTSTGEPFQIFLKPNCLVGQTIVLQLHITSNSNSYDYEYDAIVHGCDLLIDNFLVDDEGSGNSNFRMDPAESVKLVFSIKNFGDDIAPGVTALLSSNDPYITIEGATGVFGTLNIAEIAMNANSYFEVSIDASCPTGYMADFSLLLNTENGNYPYQTEIGLNIPVSLPIPTDYSGPDEYGYYAYSSNDAFYDQTPVYNWVEISETGTQINVPGISDYTSTVSLPFIFEYYGINYTQVRVSTDGWIAFGSGSQTAPLNTALPNNDNVSSMVAPFWDDLYDGEFEEGKILYYNDVANHRFIIEWDSIAHNDTTAEPKNEVFQVLIFDPAHYPTATGNGEIIFQYRDIKDITNNTVGIENHSQAIGLQYVFDEAYDPTASELINNLAIKFTTEAPTYNLITDVDDNQNPGGFNGFILEQNQPNPFSSSTWINYLLPETGNVFLAIYNVNGELVRTLQYGQQNPGKYSVMWNGLNDSQNKVSPGIYFYRLQVGNYIKTLKLLKFK